MSTTPVQTDLDWNLYMESLRTFDENFPGDAETPGLLRRPRKVLKADGAILFYVCEDHFLLAECAEHDEHTGHRSIASTVIPRDWVCFAQFFSADGRHNFFHYGPDWQDEPQPALDSTVTSA